MNYTCTAKHLFKMSEKIHMSVGGIILDSGCGDYPLEEMKKIAPVLSDVEKRRIITRLMNAARSYVQRAWAEDQPENIERMLDNSAAMLGRAERWKMAFGW